MSNDNDVPGGPFRGHVPVPKENKPKMADVLKDISSKYIEYAEVVDHKFIEQHKDRALRDIFKRAKEFAAKGEAETFIDVSFFRLGKFNNATRMALIEALIPILEEEGLEVTNKGTEFASIRW